MGIGIEQIFGKLGGFFSTNVNPIALNAIDWKYFAIYCGWITFEFIIVYLFYPETYGRTLEELAFCKSTPREVRRNERMLMIVLQCSKTRNLPIPLSRLLRNRYMIRMGSCICLATKNLERRLSSVWLKRF
jgi:hypothetical protein